MFDLFIVQSVLTLLLFGWLLYQSPRLRRLTLWLLIMSFTLLGFIMDDATNLRICLGLTAFGVLVFKLWESIPFSAGFMLVSRNFNFNFQEPFIGPEEAFPGQARDKVYDLYSCEDLTEEECGPVVEKLPPSLLDILMENFWEYYRHALKQAGYFWSSFGVYFAMGFLALLLIWAALQLLRWLWGKQHKLRRGYQSVLEVTKLQEFFPEKMAPGSQFLPSGGVKFQVEVHCSLDGGPFVYSGQAFRVGKNLWTAWHVISDADEVKLINPMTKQEMLLDGPTRTTSLFVHVEGDIAIAPLGDKLSMLSIASARFAPAALDGRSAAFVEIHARNQRSMGLLTPHTAFGYAVYSGSTIAGFSGAPYMVNKVVCGMHLGHMSVNLGYDAAYLSMIEGNFEKALGLQMTNESTEDWVYEQIGKMRSRGKKFDWSRSPYDPDEVRIRIGGRYFVVSSDVLEEPEDDFYDSNPMYNFYEGEADKGPDVAPAVLDVVYNDQGNGSMAPAPKSVSAGADGNESQVNVVAPTQTMQSVYQIATLNLSKDLETLVTNLPVSTPAQQEDLLKSIQSGRLSLEEILQRGLVYEARNRRRRQKTKQRSSTKRSEDLRAGSSPVVATPGTSSRVVSKPPLKK